MKGIVVIIDSKRGIAKNGKMPWYLPADFKHFKRITSTGSKVVLMTGTTFRAMGSRPLKSRENVVWTRDESLKAEGVKTISDADEFLRQNEDVWIIGGTALFDKYLDQTDVLYVTRIDHDFGCDRFFPEFEDKFTLFEKSEDITEKGYTFHFEKWLKKS